jgi:hypothetical protein
MGNLGQIYQDQGRLEAIDPLEAAVTISRSTLGENYTGTLKRTSARTYVKQGQADKAVAAVTVWITNTFITNNMSLVPLAGSPEL